MKFPLSWLKEYIQTTLTPEQIAEALTLIGLEVEGMHGAELSFKGVIVGKVLSTSPHPDAQKLTIAKVTDGQQEYQVVCGAPNCRPGLIVAFAKEGAELKDPQGKILQIKKTKLRGIESEGMLCAHDELGLSLEPYGVSNGIMELGETFQVGDTLEKYFGDILFEVALTPNLSHCASLIGIARELSAVTEEQVTSPVFSVEEMEGKRVEELVSVEVKNRKHCPRYTCRVITNVKVLPSPDWLKNRLESCGMRSVNNVVDITNFVLLETGHPLHAFDLDTLKDQKIVVRNALHGETILTLDGKEHFPTEDTLLICDSASPIAIAGIMGSAHTEVTEKTQTILLESAYFNPIPIRQASKRMGIQTEASRRFERGTDPLGLLESLNRAASLICKIAGGKVAYGTLDCSFEEFPLRTVSCRIERANRILGTQLAMGEIQTLFKRLGLKIKSSKNESLEVIIPSYRHDIQQEIDLIEEVARLYGYDNIHKENQPAVYQSSTVPNNRLYLFENLVRTCLLREGLQELLTCNLISPAEAELIGHESIPSRSLIKLLNPCSIDQSVLRPTLFPNMLKVAKYNQDREVHSIAGFEIGRIHFKLKDHYIEPTVGAIVLTGKRFPHHWETKPSSFDFYDLKGILENFFAGIKIPCIEFTASQNTSFHPGRQASLLVKGHSVGEMGEVHPQILRKIGLQHPVFFAEFNLEDLIQSLNPSMKMSPLPQFPASMRDWTLTLKQNFPIKEVFHLIQEQHSTILEDVSILDLYQSEKLGNEWRNVTFRFVYRDPRQTVSFKVVEDEHAKITTNVLHKLQEEKKVQI